MQAPKQFIENQEKTFYELYCQEQDGIDENTILLSYFKLRFNELVAKNNYTLNALKNNWDDKNKHLKEYLDAAQNLFQFFRSLTVRVKDFTGENKKEQNQQWQDYLQKIVDEYAITHLYNKVRNFLTKKKYSTEKFKLNFENVTLASGWDVNKESDNTCVLLRKKGLYYLAIINTEHNKKFSNLSDKKLEKGQEYFEKMNYKLLPSPNKMLPKVFFVKSILNTISLVKN